MHGRAWLPQRLMARGPFLAWLILPGLLLLPVSALAILGRFDGLYGQDPFAYYNYAVGPLRENLLHLRPPPPFFWPPGYPLFVTFASFVVGATPLAGQLVSLLMGALTPVLTALMARELLPCLSVTETAQSGEGGEERLSSHIPLLAGLLVALTPQLWQSSLVVMSDATGLAAATLGAWALARYGRGGKPGWLVLAGAALAWAAITRWIYGLVAALCATYALALLAAHARLRQGRLAVRHGLGAALAAGMILFPVLIPALIGLQNASGSAPFAVDLEVYRWSPANALHREFITADGLLRYRLPNGLYYALAPLHTFFFTPLLAPFILPGLYVVARRRALAPWLLGVGWAAIVYGFHAGAPWQNFRFTLAYLPPLAVLAAAGLAEVHRRLSARPWLERGLAAIVVIGLGWMAIGGVRLAWGFISRKNGDLEIVRRVESETPSGGRLLTFGLTLTFQHYSHLETLELFHLSGTDLTNLVMEHRPTFLLIDTVNVETQWAGRPPSKNYDWLRAGPGLVTVDRLGSYTLFKVDDLLP